MKASEKVFAILLIAAAIGFLWVYDTGRWAGVVAVVQNPAETQAALQAQMASTSQSNSGGGGGSNSGGGNIIGDVIGAGVSAIPGIGIIPGLGTAVSDILGGLF